MVNIVGEYRHERSENLDEYFREIGVPYVARKMMALSNPTIKLCQEGDEWKITNTTLLRTQTLTFKLGNEFEEHMPSGVVLRSTVTMEDNVMTITSLPPDGKKAIRKYEFSDEGMILTMSIENGTAVCKRYFKRVG